MGSCAYSAICDVEDCDVHLCAAAKHDEALGPGDSQHAPIATLWQFLPYDNITSRVYDSWWITQGFTTLGETWVLSPEFRDASINHVFLGDISAWMYNVLAGINYDEAQPGFRHILITPHFVEGLDWVKGEYRSVQGVIRSEWSREDNRVTLKVEIPDNTTATVIACGKEQQLGAGVHELRFRQD